MQVIKSISKTERDCKMGTRQPKHSLCGILALFGHNIMNMDLDDKCMCIFYKLHAASQFQSLRVVCAKSNLQQYE